jgi:hypothetical protein
MAAALRKLIETHNPVVRQGHLAWHRHLAPTDQPDVRNGVVLSARGARGDHGGAGAGKASDAMDARGLQCFGQAQRRQDGGQPARQPRCPRPRWPPEQRRMNRSPLSVFGLP